MCLFDKLLQLRRNSQPGARLQHLRVRIRLCGELRSLCGLWVPHLGLQPVLQHRGMYGVQRGTTHGTQRQHVFVHQRLYPGELAMRDLWQLITWLSRLLKPYDLHVLRRIEAYDS